MATFADFVREASLYEYSQENYNLIKECAELQVYGRFIENQRFAESYGGIVESINSSYVDGNFFMEGVDVSSIEAMEQAFAEKAGNIMNTIKNGWKKLVETIHSFFVKIMNKFDDDTKRISGVRKQFFAAADKIDAAKVSATLKEVADKTSFIAKENQPYAKKIKKSVSAGMPIDLLAAALSDTFVLAGTGVQIEKNNAGFNSPRNAAIPMDTLVKMVKVAEKTSDAQAACHELESVMSNSWRNGIKVDVNGEKLKSIVEQIKQIRETVSKAEVNANAQSQYANLADDPGETGKNATALHELYSTLSGSVSATLVCYASVFNYRRNAANALASLIPAVAAQN